MIFFSCLCKLSLIRVGKLLQSKFLRIVSYGKLNLVETMVEQFGIHSNFLNKSKNTKYGKQNFLRKTRFTQNQFLFLFFVIQK